MRTPLTEVSVQSDPSLFDEFVAVMSMLGFQGFWEDGSNLRGYVASHEWSPKRERSLRSMLDGIRRAHGVDPPSVTHAPVPEKDWNEAWEASLTPITIGERIVVTPSWHRSIAEREHRGAIIITIDPKMSFGTGYHETTRLMVTLLQKYMRAGISVLDVGTGTGILAIVSAKLGASEALGIDIDAWAVENARENVRVNVVGDVVSIRPGDISSVPKRSFGIVAANIQRSVIEPDLPSLIERTAPDGVLLLSGLLPADRTPLLDALSAAKVSVREELQENEWLAFAATPPLA